MGDVEQLSAWWARAVAFTFVLGLSVLILLTREAYQNAPPVPDRAVDPTGAVVFSGDDVRSGQEAFLKYGLMQNGTIWGHGAYLGPDFSAQYLHVLGVETSRWVARNMYHREYETLSAQEKDAVSAELTPSAWSLTVRHTPLADVATLTADQTLGLASR